jgi:hypothetical protein
VRIWLCDNANSEMRPCVQTVSGVSPSGGVIAVSACGHFDTLAAFNALCCELNISNLREKSAEAAGYNVVVSQGL